MTKKACVISSYAYIDDNINYGALLQYYALERTLKKYNIEAYWLRYTLPHSLKRKIKIMVKDFFLSKEDKEIKNCLASFKRFLYGYCHYSEKIYINEKQLIEDAPQADIYITGSDQVWGGTLAPNYLTFAPDDKSKISYAASFGKNEIPEEQKKIIRPWLERFDFISVREGSGVDICKSMGINAVQVLDPTFLIDAKDYPTVDGVDCPDVYGYFLNFDNLDQLHWDEITSFAGANNFSLKVACVNQTYSKYPEKYRGLPSPEEWLTKYSKSKYIITNTFHGTVFAIIFHKPFLVIKQHGEGAKQNGRVQSLLNSLDLEDRYYSKGSTIKEQIGKVIDWTNVEKKLDLMRQNSFGYLSRSTDGL